MAVKKSIAITPLINLIIHTRGTVRYGIVRDAASSSDIA